MAVIDESYGVGWPYYSQTGSFFAPVSPPALGPFEGPLVALPCVNYDWLRLLLGASDQLRNPSTWKDLTPAQTVVVLSQVEELQANLSIAGSCVICPMMRLQDCVLQFSCDSGATWTDVSGWAENFGPCVQSAAIITTPPPNPSDRTTDQMACSVASYLADQVISVAIQQAVDNINNNRNLLQLGVDLALIIPEFQLVGLFVNAVADLYTFFSSSTVADFEAALTDPTLFSNLRCAIYTAIATDGHLTALNFPTALSNVCGISYVHSNVIDAICAFLTTAGFAYVNQLSQGAGLNPYDDCSDCGGTPTWCYQWDLTAATGPWVQYSYGTYVPGTGWVSQDEGTYVAVAIQFNLLADTFIHAIVGNFTATDTAAGPGRDFYAFLDGSNIGTQSIDGGTHISPFSSGWNSMDLTVDSVIMRIGSQPGATNVIRWIRFYGTGLNPFGDNNCHDY